MVHGREGLVVCGGQGEGRGAAGGGGGGDGLRLGQVGAGVTVWMMRVEVGVGDAGMPRGLCIAPGDEVSVLELGASRLLCCQLELDEHHVITDTQRQGEGGAAGQEVTDLQGRNQSKGQKMSEEEENNSPVHIDFLFTK